MDSFFKSILLPVLSRPKDREAVTREILSRYDLSFDHKMNLFESYLINLQKQDPISVLGLPNARRIQSWLHRHEDAFHK